MNHKDAFVQDFVVKALNRWASSPVRGAGSKAVERMIAELYEIAEAIWNEMERRIEPCSVLTPRQGRES